MATLPKYDFELTEQPLSLDQAAIELHKIVESHFDDHGLTDAQRDSRYAYLRDRLDASDASVAKA